MPSQVPASATPTAPGTPAARRPRRKPAAAATTLVIAVAAAVVARDLAYGPPVPPVPRTARAFAGPVGVTAQLPDWLPRWHQRVETVGGGETLVDALARAGMHRGLAERAVREAGPLARAYAARPVRAGSAVYVRTLSPDSTPAEITFRPEADRVVRLRYLGGAWRAAEERLAWRTDTVGASAVVRSNVFAAVHQALGNQLPHDERSELAYKLGDIFEYRLDLDDDVRRGDSVRLVVERRIDPEGRPREAHILAAALTADGRRTEAFRVRAGGRASYFDGAGKSLRAAFLRAPLEFRRVSSGFGMRQHPILGVWKMHTGTDYSAASGTPVRAVGDGTVIFAGYKGGYGNVLEVRHRNGYVSRYGHLRGFARGVRRGATVPMGKTVGYVGATGLATAPHLHFEMLVGGSQRDPGATLRRSAADRLASRQLGGVAALRARLFGRPGARPAAGPTHVALGE